MQVSIGLAEEIIDRAIAAFTKKYDTFDQPCRALTEISNCGRFVELHNTRGSLAIYKIKTLTNGGFRLSYVPTSD